MGKSYVYCQITHAFIRKLFTSTTMTVLRLKVNFIACLVFTVMDHLRVQYADPGNHGKSLQEVQNNCVN
jgi:hypothetical protein